MGAGTEGVNEQTFSIDYLNHIETSKFKRESALYSLFSNKRYDMNTVVRTTFGEVQKNLKKHWTKEQDMIRNPKSKIGKIKMFSEFVFFHRMDNDVGYYIERFGKINGNKTEYILRCSPADPHDLNRS